jgi:hypothetical protein
VFKHFCFKLGTFWNQTTAHVQANVADLQYQTALASNVLRNEHCRNLITLLKPSGNYMDHLHTVFKTCHGGFSPPRLLPHIPKSHLPEFLCDCTIKLKDTTWNVLNVLKAVVAAYNEQWNCSINLNDETQNSARGRSKHCTWQFSVLAQRIFL